MTYYKVDMTNERSSSEINDFHYGDSVLMELINTVTSI